MVYADNWEYVVAGVLVVAGIALVFTEAGVGVSGGLIGAGISMGTQKLTIGKVSLTQTIMDGVLSWGTGGPGLLSSTRTITSSLGRSATTSLTRSASNSLTRTTSSSLAGTGSAGFGRVDSLKSVFTSKDFWIKTGVNTAKDMAFDGVSSIVETKIEGDPITVTGVLEDIWWGRVSDWTSSGTNYGLRKTLEKHVSTEVSYNLADGVSEVGGSILNYCLTNDGWDWGEFVVYVVSDSATGLGSSWSDRKMVEHGSSGGGLSSNDVLRLELSSSFLTDTSGFMLNVGVKGVYKEVSGSDDSQSEADTSEIDTPETDISETGTQDVDIPQSGAQDPIESQDMVTNDST